MTGAPPPGPPGRVGDAVAVTGRVTVTARHHDGTATVRRVSNLTTDTGDAYLAARVAAGVPPAEPAGPPLLLAGIKVGRSSSTAPAKSGTGAVLSQFIAGRQFDGDYPQATTAGPGQGANVVYQVSWGLGDIQDTIREAVLVTDPSAAGPSSTANTFARVVFDPLPLGPTDQLVVVWAQRLLG